MSRRVLRGADLPKGLPRPSEIDGVPFFTSKMLQESSGDKVLPDSDEASGTLRSIDKQDNKYENANLAENKNGAGLTKDGDLCSDLQ